MQAGLGIGFCANYMAYSEPDVVQILPEQIRIPPLPMWLAVHQEIRTNPRIRVVFDFLADALPHLI